MSVDQKNPIAPGRESAPHSHDPRAIYLAPRCCYSEGNGRLWCEDQVWPCVDCQDPKNARVAKYYLAQQFTPQSEDPEDHEIKE